MGVERALAKVVALREDNPHLPIVTIGPLIHNRRVLEEMVARGITSVSEPSKAPSGIAVIRAHGLPPEERRRYEAAKQKVVDATCPRVLASQRRVARCFAEGKFIVLVGDPEHGEIKGLVGFAQARGDESRYQVASTPEEAEAIDLPGPTLVIAQTTIKQENYDAVVEILKAQGVELEVARSICPATLERQQALVDLVQEVDALLIIGGKSSANTTALYATAAVAGKPAWHIEGAGDIPRGIAGFKRVGLSAGASTPEEVICEVEEALGKHYGGR